VRIVVKRIRKRVVKKDLEAASADGVDPENASTGLRAELAAMGEDGFTRKIAGAMGWVMDNRGMLVVGTALTVIAVTAVYVLNSQERAKSAESAGSFHLAASGYTDVLLPPPAKPGEEKPDDAQARQSKIDKARRNFEQTRKTYGADPVAALAELGEAGAHVDLGKHAEALKLYDAVLGRPNLEPMAKFMALQGKAAALETTGDTDGAIALWKTMGDLNTEAFGVMAGLQQGRILEATGRADAARTLYIALDKEHAEALKDLSNREFRANLDRRLARLGDGK
jgi:predicted negative regulator of RcsB-dependent stress response